MNPLARTELIVEEVSSETIIYDPQSHRAHCLNRIAGSIFRQCDGRTGIPEIGRRLSDAIGLPISKDIVNLGLRQLASRGLLVAKHESAKKHPSRRKMITDLAVAGTVTAALVPAITSIVAPTPAMARSADNYSTDKNNDKNKNKGK